MFTVLSSWHSHCESSPGSFNECSLSAGWPPTLRLNQPTYITVIYTQVTTQTACN